MRLTVLLVALLAVVVIATPARHRHEKKKLEKQVEKGVLANGRGVFGKSGGSKTKQQTESGSEESETPTSGATLEVKKASLVPSLGVTSEVKTGVSFGGAVANVRGIPVAKDGSTISPSVGGKLGAKEAALLGGTGIFGGLNLGGAKDSSSLLKPIPMATPNLGGTLGAKDVSALGGTGIFGGMNLGGIKDSSSLLKPIPMATPNLGGTLGAKDPSSLGGTGIFGDLSLGGTKDSSALLKPIPMVTPNLGGPLGAKDPSSLGGTGIFGDLSLGGTKDSSALLKPIPMVTPNLGGTLRAKDGLSLGGVGAPGAPSLGGAKESSLFVGTGIFGAPNVVVGTKEGSSLVKPVALESPNLGGAKDASLFGGTGIFGAPISGGTPKIIGDSSLGVTKTPDDLQSGGISALMANYQKSGSTNDSQLKNLLAMYQPYQVQKLGGQGSMPVNMGSAYNTSKSAVDNTNLYTIFGK